MALVKCKECGNEVSRKAKTCPHCGASRKRSSGCGCLLLLLLGLIILAGFSLSTVDDAPQPTPSPTGRTAPPTLQDDAQDTPRFDEPPPTTPDWKERFAYWKDEVAGGFKPPEKGEDVELHLKTGRVIRGVLKEISGDSVSIAVPSGEVSYQRASLHPKSRMVLFSDDHAKYQAALEVKKEKDRFQLDQAAYQRRKEQAESRRQQIEREVQARGLLADSELLLLSWSWHHEHGYAIVEGEVKNISGRSLKNVEALVAFYTSGNEFITSDSSLIEYNPILSEQTSPFKVMQTWNPEMQSARISFKHLFGRDIPYLTKKKLDELQGN